MEGDYQMNFRPLASSSSGNCYLLSDGDSSIMIEAGIPWRKVRQALDFKTRGIEFCLVSHSHGDHAGHIKDVMKAGIDVYAPEVGFDNLGDYNHRFHEIGQVQKFHAGDWTIQAFPCVHDILCLGFLIARGPWKCLYLSDSMYSQHKFGPGLTHIFLEVNYSLETLAPDLDPVVKKRLLWNHMSLKTAKELLKANDLSSVVEIGLLHLSDRNSDEEKCRREIQSLTGKPVFIAAA